jgi:hypothetical protein
MPRTAVRVCAYPEPPSFRQAFISPLAISRRPELVSSYGETATSSEFDGPFKGSCWPATLPTCRSSLLHSSPRNPTRRRRAQGPACECPACRLTSATGHQHRHSEEMCYSLRPAVWNCVTFGAGGFGNCLTDNRYSSTTLSAGSLAKGNNPKTLRSSCGSISMLNIFG